MAYSPVPVPTDVEKFLSSIGLGDLPTDVYYMLKGLGYTEDDMLGMADTTMQTLGMRDKFGDVPLPEPAFVPQAGYGAKNLAPSIPQEFGTPTGGVSTVAKTPSFGFGPSSAQAAEAGPPLPTPKPGEYSVPFQSGSSFWDTILNALGAEGHKHVGRGPAAAYQEAISRGEDPVEITVPVKTETVPPSPVRKPNTKARKKGLPEKPEEVFMNAILRGLGGR